MKFCPLFLDGRMVGRCFCKTNLRMSAIVTPDQTAVEHMPLYCSVCKRWISFSNCSGTTSDPCSVGGGSSVLAWGTSVSTVGSIDTTTVLTWILMAPFLLAIF